MANVTILGIDIAKNVFQLHGVDQKGAVVLKKRLKRETLLNYLSQIPAIVDPIVKTAYP